MKRVTQSLLLSLVAAISAPVFADSTASPTPPAPAATPAQTRSMMNGQSINNRTKAWSDYNQCISAHRSHQTGRISREDHRACLDAYHKAQGKYPRHPSRQKGVLNTGTPTTTTPPNAASPAASAAPTSPSKSTPQ
ncbi:MAG: hypothetical protein EBX40_02655 [Gammaproteobacteria bacterium]|nr:hypothetical protein [Gammaproteobacteria bacterium]